MPECVEEHYTPAQVAERLNVTRDTVYGYIKTGKLKRVKRLGRKSVRIPASAVNEFLDLRVIS